jgi:hypothetical protein
MSETCTPAESPLVLFARLEIAVQRGDHAAAAAAQAALSRLGVIVRYGQPEPARAARVPRARKAVAGAR